MPKPLLLEDPWESVTWEGAAKATLIAGANMTPAEKLDWLEEAAELVRKLEEGRRKASAGSSAAAVSRTPRDS